MNDSIDFIKEEEDNSDLNQRLSNIDEYLKTKVGTTNNKNYLNLNFKM